jgi:cellulose synthase/poly-beta-1,6-N-acetylglucosamine synthase-like glycosyltransferase
MNAFFLFYGLTFGLALLLLLPIFVLFIECIGTLWPPRKRGQQAVDDKKPSIIVLIPAHNEAEGIEATLENVRSQLTPSNQLVVVADNCTDDTAQIARSFGATVLERYDSDRLGKGYALAYGLEYLASNRPDVVVMVDADCQLDDGALRAIAHQAHVTSRPVQAIYLMQQADLSNPKNAVSALAFLVKNWVRPLGLHHFGMPCLLTGTGMAFPWESLQQVSLANGNIVEDMQVGLDLALAGYPPVLCPEARVTSYLPQNESASQSQRTRWEHGHLKTLLTQVPRLLKGAIAQQRLDLLGLALDLCVPPLSLLVLLWGGVFLFALVSAFLGMAALPVQVLALEGALLLIAIGLAWGQFARDLIPLTMLLTIPLYIVSKVPLYFRFLTQPQQKWIRTERDSVQSLEKS